MDRIIDADDDVDDDMAFLPIHQFCIHGQDFILHSKKEQNREGLLLQIS